MHDLALVGYLLLLLGLGLKRPFLFVLGYAYVDLVSPQRLAYYLLDGVQVSLIFFVAAVGGWALKCDKAGLRFTPRQMLLVVLLVWTGCTTFNADFPLDAADKWDWVWKTLVFAIFLPLTLRTRLRMEALVVFMLLSAGFVIIIGGIKTIVSGGGYGELNLGLSSNSGLYEGSTISAVAIASIPLVLWVLRHGTIFPWPKLVRPFGCALIFACLLIPVGTEARTGLICIAVLALLLLRDTKRRGLFIAGLAFAGLAAMPLLPSKFTQRMDTIKGYQADESASTRVAVWGWTLDYATTHPFGGGFGAYKQNKLSYEKIDGSASGSGETKKVQTNDKARAWHSSYFEMLGEQGWPGLAMWLVLNITGFVRMEVLRRRYRDAAADEAWIPGLAGALQSAHIVYMVGSLFLALAFASFAYMWMGLEIGLDTYCARRRSAPARIGRAAPDTQKIDGTRPSPI